MVARQVRVWKNLTLPKKNGVALVLLWSALQKKFVAANDDSAEDCVIRRFCIAPILFFCVQATAANLTPGVPPPCGIRFSGPIDEKTPAALEAAIRKVKNGTCKKENDKYRRIVGDKTPASLPLVHVVLQIVDSPGGDLLAAMQAGRILRRELVDTVVTFNSACASACVFMYLGGVNRSSVGALGLHRPYAKSGSESLLESQQQHKRMIALAKAYLDEMNISPRLIDLINAIPPDEIRWLSLTEKDYELKKELLIDGADPAYTDLRDSENARIFGLTRAEFYARRERVESACLNVENSPTHPDAHFRCYLRIMTGKQ
jgi:hypothetical protein